MSIQTTLREMEHAARRTAKPAAVYTIKTGDTLSNILTEHYKVAYNASQYKVAEAYALYFNRHIDHPNTIRAGQNIRLMPLPIPSPQAYCPVPDDFHHQFKRAKAQHRLEPLRADRSARLRDFLPINSQERELFYALARAQDKYHWLDATVMGLGAFEHITGTGNRALAIEVAELYQQYKDGILTRGQYDNRRAKKLKQLSQNLGGLQRFLFDGQTANEAISINRKKGIPATHRITNNVTKLSSLSKLANRGGVILTAVGGTIACNNIGNAESREEKNEIFVEFVGGAVTSALTGAALAVFFTTTPVGWAAALVIGGASVAAGWAGGEASKIVYDHKFEEHDFVGNAGIDKWCN